MRRSWPIAPLLVSLLLVPAAWDYAQDTHPPPPAAETDKEPLDIDLIERTERRLTAIDITIRAKKKIKAEPPELTVDDLEVVVTGKRRELRHVDRVCRVLPEAEVTTSVEAQVPETPSPPPPPPAPPAPNISNTFVFYLDHSHLTLGGQATALTMTKDLIKEMVPGGNKAVVVSSGNKLLQSKLSGDPDYLLSFLEEIGADKRQWLAVAYADGEESRYGQILNSASPSSAKVMAEMFLREERMYTRRELSRFSATLGALADLDPPKAVIYFADIMRKKPGLHYARLVGIEREPNIRNLVDESHAFDRVTEEAAAHGVRLYTIQAEGLLAGNPGISVRRGVPVSRGTPMVGQNQAAAKNWDRTNDAVRTLQSFALESGGEMFFGGTEAATMNKVRNRIESDLSCFYLLTILSDDLKEDSLLPLRVRFDQDAPRFMELEKNYEIQARGQLVVLSEQRKKESLLLAAHAASETVDSEVGHAAIIPLGFEDGQFQGMAQFMVSNPDLPEALIRATSWELGMTHVHREKVSHQTDRRITLTDPRVPVVLQAAWNFAPGENSLTLVGYEDRLGQLITAQLDRDWPDPDQAEAVVTQVAVVQPESAIFVNADEKANAGSPAPENRVGSLAIGEGVARVDRPMYFVSLVCRKKKDARVLWIDRTLVGNVPVEFTRQQWDRTDNERCVRIQDLIRENHVGWGDFEYHVSVYDDPSLEADPLITRVRKFTAVNPSPPVEKASRDRPGAVSFNFAANSGSTRPARH